MTTTLTAHAATVPAWRWLAARGWRIEIATPADRIKGTAACDRAGRRIVVKNPQVLARPSLRVRRYVLVHELWHAVHAEALAYDTSALRPRKLNWMAAIEVVADAACLDGTTAMKAWVRASVLWHGRIGVRYRWADVVSPEARTIVARLRAVTVNR